SGSHAYADNGTYTIRVEVRDNAGALGNREATATVVNAPPSVLTASNLTGDEGQSLAFTATFSDAGVNDTHTAVIYWGDGTNSIGQITESGGRGTVSASHTYADNGTYTIRIEVRDNDGAAGTGMATATVANVAPTVLTASNLAANEGQVPIFTATFS